MYASKAASSLWAQPTGLAAKFRLKVAHGCIKGQKRCKALSSQVQGLDQSSHQQWGCSPVIKHLGSMRMLSHLMWETSTRTCKAELHLPWRGPAAVPCRLACVLLLQHGSIVPQLS